MRAIAAILVWFLSMSQVWADGAPTDTTKSLVTDALTQVIIFTDLCSRFKINEERMRDVLKSAGLKRANLDLKKVQEATSGKLTELEKENMYLGPFLWSRNFAYEVFADMSTKGLCYHLKVRFGPEGETITNLVIPTKP